MRVDTGCVATASSTFRVGHHLSLIFSRLSYASNCNPQPLVMDGKTIGLYNEMERVVKSFYTVDLRVSGCASASLIPPWALPGCMVLILGKDLGDKSSVPSIELR